MKIWDVAPEELTDRDLVTEWWDLCDLWKIIWRARHGHPFQKHHAAVYRFEPRPWLLVVRHDFLLAELRNRGLQVDEGAFVCRLPDGHCYDAPTQRMIVTEEIEAGDEPGGWYAFCLLHDWPKAATPKDGHPWLTAGMDYTEYRGREDAA